MYCKLCNLLIAPHDPEQVVRGQHHFHGHCYREMSEQRHSPLNAHVGRVYAQSTA